MTISRTEAKVGLGLLALSALGTWLWLRSRLRLETVQNGAAQAIAVRPFRGREDFPKGIEASSYATEGEVPTALFLRLPPSARAFGSNSGHTPPQEGEIVARLAFPNGGTQVVPLQRLGSDAAMVQVPRAYPPEVSSVEVELDVPREPASSWRLLNLPRSERAYEPAPTRTEQGEGARRVFGRAWWDGPGKRWDEGASVFAALAAPGFVPGPGEACEVTAEAKLPYQTYKPRPGDEPSSTMPLLPGKGIGIGKGTPYASAFHEVRLWGYLWRKRVFDEWIDFGTVPLRPRTDADGMSRGWSDAEPDLKAPRSARTASGLELVLQPTTTDDHTGYGGEPQSVTFRLTVAPATRTKGLPPGFGGAPSVGVDRAGAPHALYSDIERKNESGQASNVVWPFFRPPQGRTVRLRMKVRRLTVLEKVPFDLRLPVPKTPEPSKAPRQSQGGSIFNVDPKTLRYTES